MAVNKVDLTVTQLLEDLNNGLTWLKKDDLGYGSIENKYGANEKQITAIRKHPKLKDAETSVTIFNIIDDTNEQATTDAKKHGQDRSPVLESAAPVLESDYEKMGTTDAADIFANL